VLLAGESGDERHRRPMGDDPLAVGVVHERDAARLDLAERWMAVEALRSAPAAHERRVVALGSAAWTARRSSHQCGASSSALAHVGYVVHTTTPPPGRTTRASSSAARAPSNQCQASLDTAPSTEASSSGSASARPASARSEPMCPARIARISSSGSTATTS